VYIKDDTRGTEAAAEAIGVVARGPETGLEDLGAEAAT